MLVSMAGEGALLLDEHRGLHRAHAPCGTVRNSVGAGDAMVAGFLAGWLQTGSYAHALKWGVAAGSATAFFRWACHERADLRAAGRALKKKKGRAGKDGREDALWWQKR